jgi:hypothetical protein
MAHAQPQIQAERDLRNAPARPFYPVTSYPDSSYPSHNPEQSRVPSRFVTGQETASVLKITKHPRLRPKDVSHRQSLGSGEQESSSGSLSGTNASGFTSPPAPPDGRFPHPTPSSEGFMVAFGGASFFHLCYGGLQCGEYLIALDTPIFPSTIFSVWLSSSLWGESLSLGREW